MNKPHITGLKGNSIKNVMFVDNQRKSFDVLKGTLYGKDLFVNLSLPVILYRRLKRMNGILLFGTGEFIEQLFGTSCPQQTPLYIHS
jgi:hypothetical protein